MKKEIRTIYCILFLFIISALIMLRQIASNGYFSVLIEDIYTHTSWAWQFTEAIKEGIIYPRWMPLNFWGYGSPTFVLYPPLAYYIVAFFDIFSNSVIIAMNITKLMSLFLSATGMFFLVREFYPQKIAFLTSVFYIIVPYNMYILYLSGNFASTISLIWFSPILIFIVRYTKTGYYKYAICAGACYGGLISTHLINAYMFTFVWVIFVVYFAINKRKPTVLTAVPFIGITGALMSSAYLLPLVYEKQFVNLRAFAEDFNFADNFILPNLTHKFPQNHFWPIYYKDHVFYVLFFSVLIAVFFLHIQKLNRLKISEDALSVNNFLMGSAIVSIFLLFGPSTLLWDNIPFFNYIQFPIRWLSITSFAVVFLSAALFYAIESLKKEKKYHYFVIAFLFAMCFLFDYKLISSAPFFAKQALTPVRSVNWTGEHLPINVDFDTLFKNKDLKEKTHISIGGGKTEILKWNSADNLIKITAYKPSTLRVRIFYFPGWKAYINGEEAVIKTEKNTGAMLINIPRGNHILRLKFEDTPIRYYSKILWFMFIFVFFSFIFF